MLIKVKQALSTRWKGRSTYYLGWESARSRGRAIKPLRGGKGYLKMEAFERLRNSTFGMSRRMTESKGYSDKSSFGPRKLRSRCVI